jgi:hypothetical protein
MRLQAQPGITGLQQVAARYTGSFDEQVKLDIAYIEQQSFWLDLKIFLQTPFAILRTREVDSANILDLFTAFFKSKDELATNILHNQNLDNIPPGSYKISVSHPKLLSMRFEAEFLFQVYMSSFRAQVSKNIKKAFADKLIEHVEQIQQSSILPGQIIRVGFFSPDFVFSDPVTKEIKEGLNRISFLGKPKDTCTPGTHQVLISISDAQTNQEFESLAISVRVVDFAFDHVSRPLLSRASSLFVGLGSVTMFILAFLQEIDRAFGLASGTAGVIVALAMYTNFFSLYKRIRPNTP